MTHQLADAGINITLLYPATKNRAVYRHGIAKARQILGE